MTIVRQAGGKGRTVVENERWLLARFGQSLSKGLVFFPEVEDFEFDLGELHVLSNRFHRVLFLTPTQDTLYKL